MKMIARLTLAGLFVAGCAQAATQPQYLTVEQYVKIASQQHIPSNKLNPNVQMSQAYFNALSEKIATAPQSAYQKNSKPYSEIDYLCSNHSGGYMPSYPQQTQYDQIASQICFRDITAWNIPYPRS
jgi:PBP1b-binding outer membrane lipoprotein LpoB